MKKKVRQFSLGMVIIIIAVLVNLSASQKNDKSNQALLLKNIGAIAWAQSETIYCSSSCKDWQGDVCMKCPECIPLENKNENGRVGICQ
jgi:hypothetical protein